MNTPFTLTFTEIIVLACLFFACGLLAGAAITWNPAGPRRPAPDELCDLDRPGPLPLGLVHVEPVWPAPGDTFSEQAAAWDRLERNVCAQTRPFRAIR